jgi:transposase-like protein
MSAFAGKGELQMSKKGVGWRPEAFRDMALERLRTCTHIGKLCQELGISPSTLRHWRKQQEAMHSAWPATIEFPGETLGEENRRLKQALAEKVLEVDFLQGALQQVEARRLQNIVSGAKVSTPRSGE